MRIAIVGDLEDLSSAYFAWVARERGAEVIELSEDTLGDAWSYRLRSIEARPDAGGGHLTIEGEAIPLESLDGAFVRLNPHPDLPATLRDLPELLTAPYTMERRYGLHRLLESIPGLVVNLPSAGRSNSSKPYQMARLVAAGLEVPRWVVTNRPDDAQDFLASCPRGAIYKSCSGLRSQVRKVDEALLDQLEDSCPVLIQEYIPGDDVRIHTVGTGHTFASRIESSGIDYRFDEGENRYTAIEAPSAVRDLCLAAAADEGLHLAGIDFRVSPEGRWWCLEINPVPTYLPYEVAAGHPIASTVLDLMAAKARARSGAGAAPASAGHRGLIGRS